MYRILSIPLCATAAASLALVLPTAAQDRVPGGRLLTFGLSTGITASDNPDLDQTSRDELRATTSLSAGLLALTPTQRFELGTTASLRAIAGGEDGVDRFALSDPNGSILYSRRSRTTELTLEGSFSRDEISTLSPLELSLDDLIDLEDIEELETLINANQIPRDARRLTFDLGATLETRRGSPFGVTYSLGVSGVRYSDAPADFDDETRVSGGLGFRFDLDEITQASADLSVVTTDDDTEEDRYALDLGITRALATDQIGLSLGVIEDGNGNRISLSANAAREFSTGRISGSAGITRAGGGNLALVGSLGYAQELSRTQDIRLDLRRRVTRLDGLNPGDPDRERAVTTLSADYSQDITRLWRLGVDAQIVQTDVIEGAGESESFGQIGADLSRPLTEDWGLTMGVSHRFEENGGGSDASSNTVSVSLNRSFRIPY